MKGERGRKREGKQGGDIKEKKDEENNKETENGDPGDFSFTYA